MCQFYPPGFKSFDLFIFTIFKLDPFATEAFFSKFKKFFIIFNDKSCN